MELSTLCLPSFIIIHSFVKQKSGLAAFFIFGYYALLKQSHHRYEYRAAGMQW